MRGLRALLTVLAIGVGGVASGSVGGGAAGCAGGRWCTGDRLPAAVTLVGESASYRIDRGGHIRRVAGPAAALPPDAALFPGGTWYVLRRGHLVVGRGRHVLWRSRQSVGSPRRLGVVIASARMVTYQHDHRLYLARLSGAERAVATAELPLGWTRGGLYTYRYRGRELLLRSDSGRLVKVIARPLGSDYDLVHGRLYFISGGILESDRGGRTRPLVSLASLGLSPDVWLQPLGRWLELETDDRIVVLRADGSVLAWMPTPGGHSQSVGISSDPAVAPDARSLAFTVADRRSGAETVYLLRPPAHSPVPLYRARLTSNPCAGGATVEWHRSWLLYAAAGGRLALIDTRRRHRVLDLTARVARLPGMGQGFGAHWSR